MIEEKPVSVWNYKPWWCQPWSILLVGITIIGGAWLISKLIFGMVWLTLLVAIPVLTWMGFFLLLYPQLVVRSGLLDSYQAEIDNSPREIS